MDTHPDQHQTELDSLAAWQKAILDSSEYGIISTDTQGVIATFNRTSEELLGYRSEEMIGRQTPEIIHDPAEVVDYAEQLSNELGQTIQPGFDVFVARSRLGKIDNREWTYIRKDGSTFPVYLSVTSIRDTNQEIVGYLGTFLDLTERKNFQSYIRETETRYRALFNNASDAIFLLGQDASIVDCNPATMAMLGCSRKQVLQSSIEQFSPERQPDGRISRVKAKEKIALALAGEPQFFEWRYTRRDGTAFDAEVDLNAVTIGEVPHLLGTVRDITERKRLHEQLAWQAGHDSLTELPNRKTLHESFAAFQRTAGAEGKSVAMLLLDLDRFKEINDTLGHRAGDWLLTQIGPRLHQACSSEPALIARLGGDEFAILTITDKSEEEICRMTDCFLRALKQPFTLDGLNTSISASIGIACYPQHGEDSHELLRAADVAMYYAKKRAHGVKLYTPEIDGHSREHLRFASELVNAVKLGQLVMHYQPKIDIQSNEIAGFEALVRWQHPELGLLLPAAFINLVEISEVLHPFTQAVIEQVLSDKKKLSQLGYKQPCALNLSTRNLLDDDCFLSIDSALARHNLSPVEIELELTESSVMLDPQRAITLLNRFKNQGTSITIDDFGTGYSSLVYLRQLPVSTLKIDKTFVREMLSSTQDSAIVRSTIALAHSLDLKVVAEGVEDQQALELLASMDCDQAQGFGICRPQSFSQLLNWLGGQTRKLRVVN